MKAFSHLRVLDLTHGVAGPYATMLLADLGCDVIKLEKPHRGDPTRYMNVSDRFASRIPDSGGDYFMAINRNKRSVTIDLKTDAGRELALRLAARADVVVQSFRPGVVERLGLGPERLRADRPELIYASLSAYGEHGPLAHQPGMDVAVQARSGVMSITGQVGSTDPIKPGVSLADFAGGTHLALAVVAALVERAHTGLGQTLSVSLLDSTMAMLTNYSVAVVDGEAQLGPMGSGHPQLAPFEALPTSDGYIVIAPGTNRLFRELCGVLGRVDLVDDARFKSNELRVSNRLALTSALAGEFVKRSTAEWLEILERAAIPCAPVNTIADAFGDEQLVANDMLVEVSHPSIGLLTQLRSPYRFDGRPLPIALPPPELGEHTHEVLTSVLGIDEGELAELRSARTI